MFDVMKCAAETLRGRAAIVKAVVFELDNVAMVGFDDGRKTMLNCIIYFG